MRSGYSKVLVIEGRASGPDYIAKMPIEGGKWVKVGYAYFNPKTESFTVYFDILPDREKIVLFKNK
jgi:hypothetical protein